MGNTPTGINDESTLYPMDWRALVDRYYGGGENPAGAILLEHSRAVADMALRINEKCGLGLDAATVENAAMLHDIGIFMTYAPGIGCNGTEPYIRHGILGAGLLRRHGFDERFARVAERHTGTGITDKEIIEQGLPLPTGRSLTPESELERLICYADKFFSKRPGSLSEAKSLDRVRSEMASHGADTLARFEALHGRYSK